MAGTRSRTGFRRWRLMVLVSILAVLSVAGALFHAVVWHYERQLRVMGEAIVAGYNESDPEPVSDLGPEAWVEIDTTMAFKHLFFGEKTGKITLTIHPYPHAPVRELGGISYIYTHRDGVWEQEMSYHEEF